MGFRGLGFNTEESRHGVVENAPGIHGMSIIRSLGSRNAGRKFGSSHIKLTKLRQIVADGRRWDSAKASALSQLKIVLYSPTVKDVMEGLSNDVHTAACFYAWAVRSNEAAACEKTFARLVKALCSELEHATAWDLIQDMDRLAYMIDPDLFTALIECYGKLRRVDSAVEVYLRMKGLLCKPALHTYEMLIGVVAQTGFEDEVFALYSAMLRDGLVASRKILTHMLYALASGGEPLPVKMFIQGMKKMSCTLDGSMHSALVAGFAKGGNTVEAQAAFQEMWRKAFSRIDVPYNMLLIHLCRVGNLEDALQLYECMFQTSSTSLMAFDALMKGLLKVPRPMDACRVLTSRKGLDQECLADVLLYTNVVHALCSQGYCDMAVQVVEEMKECKVTPDVVTYTSLMDGLCKTGKLELAIKIFEHMQEEGCKPNACTYNVLIDGLCKFDRLEEAFKLLKSMSSNFCIPDLMNKNTLVNGICKRIVEDRRKRHFGKHAQRVFLEEVEHSFRLEAEKLELLCDSLEYMFGSGEGPNRVTYSIVLHFLCKVDRQPEAQKVWQSMKQKLSDVDTVTYNSFLYGLVRIRDLAAAEELYQEMHSGRRNQPTIVTHSLLMDGYFKQGKHDRASGVYDSMLEQGLSPDLPLYNIMLNGLCKAKLGCEAKVLSCDMLQQGLKPSVETYTILIQQALFSSGSLKSSKIIIDHMKDRGCAPDVVTFNLVLHFFWKNGHFEEAVKLFRDMKDHCGYSVTTLSIMVEELAKLEDPEVAYNTFAQLADAGCFPDHITRDTFLDRLLHPAGMDSPNTLLSLGYKKIVEFFQNI